VDGEVSAEDMGWLHGSRRLVACMAMAAGRAAGLGLVSDRLPDRYNLHGLQAERSFLL
jgi:hypothetical protein